MKFLPRIALSSLLSLSFAAAQAEPIWIAAKGGVYRSVLDEETGELSQPQLVCSFASGSFLAIHPELDLIYSSYRGEDGAGYASLKPKGATGEWELQSLQLVESACAHLAVSAEGRFLAGSHWGGKSNYVFELEQDGSISQRMVRLQQEGSGPGHSQDQARPHWVTFAGNDRFLHAVDLGSDEIWTYEVGESVESISLMHKVKFPLGTGPRHMAMDVDSGRAYVSGELNLFVNTLHYDGESGRFSPLQYIAAAEADSSEGRNSLSEIQAHANGRFVYTAVRGLDLIVAFAVDPDTGLLSLVERQAAMVEWPRNFTISHNGEWLIVAGQRSDSIQVFAIDQETGALDPVGSAIGLKGPMCVRAWGRL